MIRAARETDIQAIADTYIALLTYEKRYGGHSNWVLDLYPTIKVPASKVPAGEMFVLEENRSICASMVLNHDQPEDYKQIPWRFAADAPQVLVIHTLCVPPEKAGRGYGSEMVLFAKQYAQKLGCTVIRMDTFAYNEPAKALYQKHGFRIAGYGPSLLEGLIPEELAYLEYKV